MKNVKLLNNKKNKIELDFIGKDSIRYQQELVIDQQVLENIKKFCHTKKDGQSKFIF